MSSALNPEEVSALMSAIQQGRVDPAAARPPGPAVAYDLTSRDRIIRGQMPTLDAMNEQIASAMEMGLSGRTRLNILVASGTTRLLKLGDLGASLVGPQVTGVLALGHGDAQGLVMLDAPLADALLGSAMGDRRLRPAAAPATPAPADTRHDLTGVEQRVLKQLLTVLTDAMAAAWAPVLPLQPVLLRFEPDPRMVSISPLDEIVLHIPLTVSGAISGQLQLVIPYPAVETAKARLISPPRQSRSSDRTFAEAWARELSLVSVELRGVLGQTQLHLSRLMELQVGDVLTLDSDEAAPLDLLVQGSPKLHGHPLVVNGAYALTLVDGLKPANELHDLLERTPLVAR
jgi:flagellar motor switch protein FliM